MPKKMFLLFHCLLFTNFLLAQDITKLKTRSGNNTYIYYELKPALPIKGLLILLPAFGEKPKDIFNKTQLPAVLTGDGFATVIAQTPESLFADDESINELNNLIGKKLTQYNLTYNNVVIGGLSAGGALALGYAESLNKSDKHTMLKAVFAIDPPADLERIYASAERKAGYNCMQLIKREGENGIVALNNIFGGSPAAKREAYIKASTFTASEANGGNAQFLKTVNLRLYSEPDLEFVRKTYCQELQFSDLNAFDLEKLIAFLKNAGNNNAAYIQTTGKGFHSWNILDAANFREWVLGLGK